MVIEMTELKIDYKALGNNLIPKMEMEMENCDSRQDKAVVVVKTCSLMVNLYSTMYPMHVILAWMEYVVSNYLGGAHKYKDTYTTVKEILRACEESDYAWNNERLIRLLNL